MSTATTGRSNSGCSTTGVHVLGRLLPAAGDDDDGLGGMGFLRDVLHPDVTDALLGFVYDPPAADAGLIDEFLRPLPGGAEAQRRRCCCCDGGKRPRACAVDGSLCCVELELPAAATQAPGPEFVAGRFIPRPPPPPPPVPRQHWQLPDHAAFVRGSGAQPARMKAAADQAGYGRRHQAVQSAAARERRRRITGKTAELSRLIPGASRLNSTAEMLQAAARYVKLLQAQVGVLALMRSAGEAKKEVPSMAEERMHALLASGGAQERLAGEGMCLVPTKLVRAIAGDKAIKSSPAVKRDLNRFMESLEH